MSHLFAFALGLLKPYPEEWHSANDKKSLNALQNISDNKLLDLKILRVIHDYLYAPFYFTSKDVEVDHRVIIADGVNGVTLQNPVGLCELSDGCIAIAERNGKINIFKEGVRVKTIIKTEIRRLMDICTNYNDHLLVIDDWQHESYIFERCGFYLLSFGRPVNGKYNEYIRDPRCICVNSLGQILVSNHGNDNIFLFDSDGVFMRIICKIEKPSSICVDMYDNIYVSIGRDDYIYKFSPDGAILNKFGSCDHTKDLDGFPKLLCVSRDGKYIVAADNQDGCIKVLSGLGGSFITSYGDFSFITGCIITYDGCILVTDFNNNNVIKIRCIS